MRTAAVRKLYADVNGAERFRLLAFALSRDDLLDAEHLIATAPRVDVVARDLDFLEAHRRFVALRSGFDRLASPLLGWLVLLDLIEPVAANLVGEAAAIEARIHTDPLRGYLKEARRVALSEIKGILHVLDEIGTDQLGLGADAILGVPMPGCSLILQTYRDEIERAEVDPEDLPGYRAELDGCISSKDGLHAVS